jgi:HEPN domain-containing protein
VAKVVAFGSVAEGTARPDSDIDVLVVTTVAPGPVKRTAQRVAGQVFDATGQWVEVHTYPVGAWLLPQSLFMLEAQRGKEVYSMDDATIRRAEAQKYVGLALTYRETAASLLSADDVRVAADAAHNAVELVLKALLLLGGEKLPRSHREVINNFALAWRGDLRLPRGMARRLHQSLDTRNRARYDPDATITNKDAQTTIGLADTVLNLLRDELARRQEAEGDSEGGHEGAADRCGSR